MQAKLGNDGVLVVGKATRDAEYKLVGAKNSPLCKIGIVVGKYPDGNARYANIDAWYEVADACKGIRKGDPVLAVGTIEEREYQGKTYKTLRAEFVSFAQTVSTAAAAQADDGFTEVPDSELPFR